MTATAKQPLSTLVTRFNNEVVERTRSVAIIADPFQIFPQLNEGNVIEAMGYIPEWMMQAFSMDEPWAEGVCSRYVYGAMEMKGSKIDEYGYMTYPGDPDLAPIALALRPDSNEVLLQYPHGIVAFISPEGEQKIVRMD